MAGLGGLHKISFHFIFYIDNASQYEVFFCLRAAWFLMGGGRFNFCNQEKGEKVMPHVDSFSPNAHFPLGGEDDGNSKEAGAGGAARFVPGFQILEALIEEGAALKREIEAKTVRLRSINLLLSESAPFESGQKTACLIGGGYKVRIRLHDNITWDQEKIGVFSKYLPEEKFAELFKTIYEPRSKKAIDGFIAHADKDLSAGLKWCMSVTPGAPRLTYEKMD